MIDEEPGWFLRFRNNDYKHFKTKVDSIETTVSNIQTKVNLSWKLQLVVLGAILTGAVGILILVIGGLL